MTARGKYQSVSDWVRDYCKRHNLPLPPSMQEEVEADDAGHVTTKTPPPKPWNEADKEEP